MNIMINVPAMGVGKAQGSLGLLKKAYPTMDVTLLEQLPADKALLEKVEILVTHGFDFNEQAVLQMPNLRWVQALRAGVDNFPAAELQRRGIPVTTVRGIHGIPMAEHALGMMLSFSRGLFASRDNQQKKIWNNEIPLYEIYEKTIAVVGAGSIGSEIAKRAKALGMRTLGFNTEGCAVAGFDQMFATNQLKGLLAESDFVVITLPLTEETHHLFGEEQFSVMKPGAYLINLARGQVLNEAALIDALEQKQIAGAGLDVFKEEPLPASSPLWAMSNVIITPHVAAISPRYIERAMKIFAHNLQAFVSGGDMINVMDWKKGY